MAKEPVNNNSEDDEGLVTGAEVAKHFRVRPSTVRRWVKEGSLAGICIPPGGQRQQVRLKKQDVRKFDPNF